MRKVFSKVLLSKVTVFLLTVLLVCTTLPLAGLFAGADTNTDLLVNGDFEDGTTGFSTSGTAKFEVIADPDNASNHILHVVGGATGGGYHQAVTVEKNTDYVFKFRMKDLGNTGSTRMCVHPGDAWTHLVTSVTDDSDQAYSNLYQETAAVATYNKTWQTFTVKFNSKDNTTVRLWHNMWASNREVYMDDWTLTKVGSTPTPPPSDPGLGTEGVLVNGDFENGTNGFSTSGTAKFEVIADPDNAANHILHVVGGASGGGYHQLVAVAKNTDYVWTFRMKDLGNTGTTRICVHPASNWSSIIKSATEDSTQAYSSMIDGTAAVATYDKTWQTFTIKFNSGENTSVKLWHNMWASNREVYMDDWTLTKVGSTPTPPPSDPGSGTEGVLVNGDFENGTNGFSTSSTAKFEVIADPDNAANHILHVVGGATGGGYHQQVNVAKNTDYVWTFRMKDLGNTNTTRICVHPASNWSSLITAVTEDSTQAYSALNSDSTASIATYDKTWQTFTIKFNSGENTAVKLWHNMWASNREVYMDDWTLAKAAGGSDDPGADVNAEIKNGDFEKGLENWTTTSQIKAEVVTDEVHGGEKALKLGAKSAWNNAFLYQEVAVKKNTDYVWSFWFKCDSAAVSNKVLAGIRTADGSQLLPSTITSPSGFIMDVNASYDELRASNVATNWHQGMTTPTWSEYRVAFNSGDQSKVLITLDMFYDNRAGWTDDWTITEGEVEIKTEIINGDFENGTTGYVNLDTTVYETIEDPDNAGNHILYYTGSETRGKGSVYQVVEVKPDTDYIWSFKFKQGENTQNDYTKISVVDGNSWTGLECKISSETALCDKWGIKSPNEWSVVNVIFNSGSYSSVKLNTNAWASTSHIYFDDWTIAEYSYNTLENPGFEEGTDGYTAEGTEIALDKTNANTGENALKITGAGKVVRKVKVDPYNNAEWKFFFKANSPAGFAVSKADGTLIPSEISVVRGNGTAEPASYDSERAEGYHTVTSAKYTEYSIKFDTKGYTELLLVYNSDIDITAYTDDWYLYGEKYLGDETILNADFEAGHTGAYEGDPYVKGEITTEDVHSGKYATVITKNTTLGSGEYYQTVKVKKNSDYIWTFWLKFNNNETPVGAQIKNDSGLSVHSRINGECDTTVEPSFAWHRIRYVDNGWHEYKVFFSTKDAESVNLIVLAYASSAQLTTDDWSLEYVGETVESDTIFNVDFEDEDMGCHEISNPCWTVTDEEVHSGKYAIKYDGKSSKGPTDLLYLDEHGIIRDNAELEKNTNYRFSFWYKGKGKLPMANIKFVNYNGNNDDTYNAFFGCEDEEWNYCEYIVNTGEVPGHRFQLLGTIVGSAAYVLYIDDIKLEKITEGVIDSNINPETVTCEKDENLAPEGSSPVTMDNNYSSVKKLKLRPFGIYNFAASFKATAANGKIGLALDKDGTPLAGGESIFTVTDTSGEAQKMAYTFCAPADGVVYLVMNNDTGVVEVDDITLYSLLPEPVVAKEKITIENTNNNTGSSIWDEEFEFDFDWNMNQGIFGDSTEQDTEENKTPDNQNENSEVEYETYYEEVTYQVMDEVEEETIEETEDNKSKGKKFMRVKKRSLVSKGEPGISVLTIVLICAGAVILSGSIIVLIIFLLRKNKKKSI